MRLSVSGDRVPGTKMKAKSLDRQSDIADFVCRAEDKIGGFLMDAASVRLKYGICCPTGISIRKNSFIL